MKQCNVCRKPGSVVEGVKIIQVEFPCGCLIAYPAGDEWNVMLLRECGTKKAESLESLVTALRQTLEYSGALPSFEYVNGTCWTGDIESCTRVEFSNHCGLVLPGASALSLREQKMVAVARLEALAAARRRTVR
jgi:hypothetical protein